jgi:hypothetical protein
LVLAIVWVELWRHSVGVQVVGDLESRILDLFAPRPRRVAELRSFQILFQLRDTLNERLELDQIVVPVVELEVGAEGVQDSDQQLMRIMLFIVSKVARRGPNRTKDFSRDCCTDL